MNPITATLDSGRIRIHADARDRELVKLVPGARHDHRTDTWTVALGWPAALALRSVFGSRLQVDEALDRWGWEERQRQEAVTKAKAYEAPLAEAPHLYPFQRSGVRFLRQAQRALLADEMGTGKTIQVLAALDSWPALVICTNAMKYQWEAEAARWLPQVNVIVVDGAAGKRAKALASVTADWDGWPTLVVVGWGALRYHSRLAGFGSIKLTDAEREAKELNRIPWGTVIADEAHRMADPYTKQTRAAWAVMHQAEYRWGLTGSPVTNHPATIWPVMHGIAPEEYPSRPGWIDRYALAGRNFFGGLEINGLNPATREEFFAYFDTRFLRRTKAEVLPDLPPKSYTTREVDMQPKQAKAYKAMATEMIAKLDGGILFATNPLTQLARLIQCAAAVPVLDPEGAVSALEAPSCKVAALFDILDELGGESVVVFTVSRKLADLVCEELEKAKVTHTRVTGTENAAERALNVQGFQEGLAQVIVCTMGAGGEGITLTRASRAVFLQRSFSLPQNIQAEDRIHRIGQEENVEIIDVITRGTIEARIHALSEEKLARFQEVVRDPEIWRG